MENVQQFLALMCEAVVGASLGLAVTRSLQGLPRALSGQAPSHHGPQTLIRRVGDGRIQIDGGNRSLFDGLRFWAVPGRDRVAVHPVHGLDAQDLRRPGCRFRDCRVSRRPLE